jgi:hypothetical protein
MEEMLKSSDQVAQIAKKYLIIPLCRIGNKLTVVTSNPLNARALREAETTSLYERGRVPLVGAELDGGWPLSLRLQFAGSASWQSLLYRRGTRHDFSSDISLSYLVGELLRLDVHCFPQALANLMK